MRVKISGCSGEKFWDCCKAKLLRTLIIVLMSLTPVWIAWKITLFKCRKRNLVIHVPGNKLFISTPTSGCVFFVLFVCCVHHTNHRSQLVQVIQLNFSSFIWALIKKISVDNAEACALYLKKSRKKSVGALTCLRLSSLTKLRALDLKVCLQTLQMHTGSRKRAGGSEQTHKTFLEVF